MSTDQQARDDAWILATIARFGYSTTRPLDHSTTRPLDHSTTRHFRLDIMPARRGMLLTYLETTLEQLEPHVARAHLSDLHGRRARSERARYALELPDGVTMKVVIDANDLAIHTIHLDDGLGPTRFL